MDLNATRMFVGVVQAGSLSAAATRLGIPLPTLSRRIRDLERQLKVQLLERSARGAKLTDAGSPLISEWNIKTYATLLRNGRTITRIVVLIHCKMQV
jgi:molybdenum-dependent DNA-binding transcriptional regulator ModE